MDGCHGKEGGSIYRPRGAMVLGQVSPYLRIPKYSNILPILEYSMENISLLLSGECSRGLPCISFNSDENWDVTTCKACEGCGVSFAEKQ